MLDWFVLLTPLLLLPIVLLFVFVGCEFTIQPLPPFFGQPGDIPVPGDYFNEGVARVAVYHPSTGIWEISNDDIFQPQGSSTISETIVIPPNGPRKDDVPVPGDYGAGHTELGVFRPSAAGASAQWFIFDAVSKKGWNTFTFPIGTRAGDIPLPPGHYLEAGGVRSVVVFRPPAAGASAQWFFSDLTGKQGPIVTFGQSGDIPIPGDYLGMGTTQLAVFRPSVGNWVVLGVGGSTHQLPSDRSVPFNSTSDTPLPPRLYQKPGPQVGPAIYHSTDGTYELFDQKGESLGLVNSIIPPPFSAMRSDLAAPGEYEGFGLTDEVIFRSANGMWFMATVVVRGGF